MACSARRSLVASLKVLSGWPMTTGTGSGMPERVTLHQSFTAELGSASRAREPGCPAAVLRNMRLAFDFALSSTPRRIPSRSGMHDTSTSKALQAVVDLDLDDLLAIEPPRGYGRD
jgi:hypothetical protein